MLSQSEVIYNDVALSLECDKSISGKTQGQNEAEGKIIKVHFGHFKQPVTLFSLKCKPVAGCKYEVLFLTGFVKMT